MSEYHLLSDLQLANLLKGDDKAAFTEIYRRYASRLTGFASSKLYELDDARDIVHDVFVKFWEQRQSLQVDRSLEAYLFTMVRYRIIDKIRKNVNQEEYLGMVLALQEKFALETEQRVAVNELKIRIRKALEELPPRVREVYHLSREENLPVAQIAGRLLTSEQTVKNQLTTALKHLRKSLSDLSVLFWAAFVPLTGAAILLLKNNLFR